MMDQQYRDIAAQLYQIRSHLRPTTSSREMRADIHLRELATDLAYLLNSLDPAVSVEEFTTNALNGEDQTS